jgi:polysaccharide biosynthesis protein PslH
MRVLYISYEPPFFPGGGGETRQYNLLKHLSKRHEIDLFLPHLDSPHLAIAQQISRSVHTPPPHIAKLARLAYRVMRSSHPDFTRAKEGIRFALIPIINRMIETNGYDLIHIEHSDIAHWIDYLKIDIPCVITAQNVKPIMWQRYADQSPPNLQAFLTEQAKRFRSYDSNFLPLYSRIIAVSDADRIQLEHTVNGMVPVDVVDNGVDTNHFLSRCLENPHKLVFTGTINHPPNRDGIIDFVNNTLPLVRNEIPSVALDIVGMNPPPEVKALAMHPDVTVTGFVPDTRPYISSAAIAIAPLKTGSGTRLKILEAMSMSTAVVSTSIGAEGIKYTNQSDIVIADTNNEFAAQIVTLLKNRERRAHIGKNARILVTEQYDWRYLAAKQEEVWQRAIRD